MTKEEICWLGAGSRTSVTYVVGRAQLRGRARAVGRAHGEAARGREGSSNNKQPGIARMASVHGLCVGVTKVCRGRVEGQDGGMEKFKYR